MLITYHSTCRSCTNRDLKKVFSLGEHYLHGSFVFKNYNPPKRKFPSDLVFCDPQDGGCGLLQMKQSLDPSLLYDKYGYRSSINEKMRRHLEDSAREIYRTMPNIDRVLDVASNDGFLLSCYPNEITKVGIDPCDAGSNSSLKIPNYTFIQNLYPSVEMDRQRSFDVITCFAMFYDANNPTLLAQHFYGHLKVDGLLVVEVSYWPEKMRKVAVDELCEEHVCFYSYSNLETLFTNCGFNIVRAIRNDSNGGSIQLWLSKVSEDKMRFPIDPEWLEELHQLRLEEFEQGLDDIKTYQRFAEEAESHKQSVIRMINSINNEGKKIHLYGASTKSNVVLQYWGLDKQDIPYASERNEEKWGGKTLGTEIEMIPEEKSRAMNPDYYLCLIWGFAKQVLIREKEYIDNGGKFIFCTPEVKIVAKDNYESVLKQLK